MFWIKTLNLLRIEFVLTASTTDSTSDVTTWIPSMASLQLSRVSLDISRSLLSNSTSWSKTTRRQSFFSPNPSWMSCIGSKDKMYFSDHDLKS